MASDTNGSGEPVVVTVKVAVPVTTVPSGFVAMAVMAVVPAPTAVARPVVLMIVPTEVLLEVHFAWFVRSFVVPAPVVPIAMNWAVWLIAKAVCDAGMIVSETTGSAVLEMFTVSVAMAVTTVPSGFEATATIAAVPSVRAVTTPVAELTAATAGLL